MCLPPCQCDVTHPGMAAQARRPGRQASRNLGLPKFARPMSTPTKSSLTTRLPRHRLWFAGAGVAGIAVVAGWMMLNTNPGNALMRPPALVESRRRLPAERVAVGGLPVRQGRADRLPRGAGDRRPDRHQRGHDHAGVLALFRPRQPPDRQARRPCRARRAAVRHRGERVRPGPQRSGHRGRRRRQGEVEAGARADGREAPARPAGDPRRRAEGPRAGAVGPGAGAGRPARRRDHAGGGAQSPAHPRPQRRGDRRPREARSRRRGDHRGGADRRHRHPAQGRAGPVHQRRRQRPGLHDRRPVDGVAGRQCARVRRAQDEGRRAGPRHRARLPRPGVQRQARLRGAGARSQHAPPAGARRDQEPQSRAQARDVRLLPHRLGRQTASMPAVPADSIVYEGANARVWVARPDSKTVVSRARSWSATPATAWSRSRRGSVSARPS